TWSSKPRVGFCGFPGADSFLDRFRPTPKGMAPRPRALRAVMDSPHVETNFVLRKKFNGGSRRAFVENMVQSDYVLCVRGAGNFSYRLYETLSCGRIPVFIDTNCVLPAEDLVKWRDVCVWVDEADVDHVGEIVAEFHSTLSPADFVAMQV